VRSATNFPEPRGGHKELPSTPSRPTPKGQKKVSETKKVGSPRRKKELSPIIVLTQKKNRNTQKTKRIRSNPCVKVEEGAARKWAKTTSSVRGKVAPPWNTQKKKKKKAIKIAQNSRSVGGDQGIWLESRSKNAAGNMGFRKGKVPKKSDAST